MGTGGSHFCQGSSETLCHPPRIVPFQRFWVVADFPCEKTDHHAPVLRVAGWGPSPSAVSCVSVPQSLWRRWNLQSLLDVQVEGRVWVT